MIEDWYRGRRTVVTGCHSGIGAAVAEALLALDAIVIGLDSQPTARSGMAFLPLDLRDAGAIADTAVAIGEPIDALFNCAGVSQSIGLDPIDVMRVNFIGTRALTEALLPRIVAGGAIASIASSAGWGWRRNLDRLRALIATEGYRAAEGWVGENADLVGKGYNFSKEAVVLWTMATAARTITRGVRMNCICPGPVDTPMLDGIIADIGMAKVSAYAWPIGRLSRPEEQAAPLIFLNSGAASYLNGQALDVDGGLHGASEAGVVDLATMLANAAQVEAA